MEAEGEARGLNSCLGWVYMLEMLLKILVFGWNGKRYGESLFRFPPSWFSLDRSIDRVVVDEMPAIK